MDIKDIIIIISLLFILFFKIIEWYRNNSWDKEVKKLINEMPQCEYPGCDNRASVKYLGFNEYCTEHMTTLEDKGEVYHGK